MKIHKSFLYIAAEDPRKYTYDYPEINDPTTGILIFDIQQPKAPTLVTILPSYPHLWARSFTVRRGILTVHSVGSTLKHSKGACITKTIDVNNPNRPTTISELSCASSIKSTLERFSPAGDRGIRSFKRGSYNFTLEPDGSLGRLAGTTLERFYARIVGSTNGHWCGIKHFLDFDDQNVQGPEDETYVLPIRNLKLHGNYAYFSNGSYFGVLDNLNSQTPKFLALLDLGCTEINDYLLQDQYALVATTDGLVVIDMASSDAPNILSRD